MATDDKQVLVTGQAPTPATFKIPGNGQLQPKSVYASFDGSGAAGDFQPALKIFSDAGEVVGVYPTAATVTAGASADVSWFPRVGGQTGGVTATTLAFARAWNDHFSGDPFQNIPTGTSDSGSFAHTETTDSAIISFSTAVNTNDTVTLHAQGAYLLSVGAAWETIDPQLVSTIFKVGAGQNALLHTPFQPNQAPLFNDGLGIASSMDFTLTHVTGVAHSNIIGHSNLTGVDRVVEQCYFTIVYLGTG